MVTKGNFAETEARIKEFVAKGDFTKPFVLAGWPGVGKSSLVYKIDKELSLPITHVADYNLDCDDDDMEVAAYQEADYNLDWDDDDMEAAACQEAEKFLADYAMPCATDGPTIFCITTGLNISIIRDEIIDRGIDVHFLTLDTSEWLEWAKSRGEDGLPHINGRVTQMLSANPNMINSYLEARENDNQTLIKAIDEAFVENGNGFNAISKKLEPILDFAQWHYLFQDEIEPLIAQIMSHLRELRKQCSDIEAQSKLALFEIHIIMRTGRNCFY